MSNAAPTEDPFSAEHEVECDRCGWTAKLRLELGPRLRVGDFVYKDPTNAMVGKCRKCKASGVLRVTKAPVELTTTSPKGFWKVPTE